MNTMNNINILIIDDDQKIIDSLKRILNKNEYILYSSTDSLQALEVIKNYKIDIIICDYNMPIITGIDLLKLSKDILPDAKKILITGESDLNITISAINEVGIYYYLSKPWNNDEVISVVEKAVLEKQTEEKKNTLFEILNNSKDYLVQTASMLNSVYNPGNCIPNINETNLHKNNPPENNRFDKKFTVVDNEDIILINSTEIYYFTTIDGNVFIISEKGKYKSNDFLNTWEKKLTDNFFRCHRAYIVNIDKIDKISPWFNGAYNLKFKKISDTIPVSRGYMKKLKEVIEI